MEKLKGTEQKEIVDSLISELSKEHPDLYYTDSSSIANLVYEKIHSKGALTKQKFDTVKDLSSNDILIVMSYNTNCC